MTAPAHPVRGVTAGAPAPPHVACTHCGLEVAPALRHDAGPQFCCTGCETAYAVIQGSGLEAYYRFGERRAARVQASGRAFEEFDHPAFATLYVRRRHDGLLETELYLENVHCASCVWLVERASLALPGVHAAELDVGRSRVRLVWDAHATRLSDVARFLDSLGYVPHPWRGGRADDRRRAEDRTALVRMGVAGAIAGNVMLIALAIYAGWFGGMTPDFARYFRWWSLALATPSLLWPGRVFFRSAWAALRRGALHMDVPIAIALAAGWLHGAVNTIRDSGPVYFDGVATLVFLLLVGRFLQQRAQRAAVDAAELLSSLAPSTALVVERDTVREIPREALLPGATIEVRAGDTIAADGVVVEGASAVDMALLTGESRPMPVGPGTDVFAGTVNVTAPVRVRVTGTGEASRLGALLKDVETAAQRRSPVVHLADRMAGWFVAAVLAVAAATALVWFARDPSRAVDNAIAVLVVTCPCALALATPLAVTSAIGKAAAHGILVRGGDALESLARTGTIILDKTGTVTEGRLDMVAWTGPRWVQPLVVALERRSQHPVAVAFTRAWAAGPLGAATDVMEEAGGGVSGVVSGHRVAVGSARFAQRYLADQHAPLPAPEAGCTAAYVVVDGEPVGVASFDDPLRADAAESIAALRLAGWRVALLSGDAPDAVARVATALDIPPADVRGGVSPEGKRQHVEEVSAQGPVVMVGDGVNDAAAMAAATVGVGMHGGAEACLATADVFTTRSGLRPVVELVRGARRTMSVIRVGIGVSITYNLAGAGLAMAGRINPLVAAVLMPLSSLTVVLLAWRAPSFGSRVP